MEVISLLTLAPAAFNPHEIFPILISVRGWVEPMSLVWRKELRQWKIPMTPSGIGHVTLRLYSSEQISIDLKEKHGRIRENLAFKAFMKIFLDVN